ncbi:MAG: M48 family metalloprotease [Acidobacteriia bacterium]|nr:M48 family metalloprotease [Terriglobia bacterium]
MAMTQEQFEGFVRRLEAYAREHPGSYALRVTLLAALGYFYIGFILLGLLAANVALAYVMIRARTVILLVQFGLPLLALTGTILRALWVKFPEPQGLRLGRDAVVRLFDVVEEIRRLLRAPPVNVILLTHDFNAGVADVPRTALLGSKRFLAIGLPLMQALGPPQFRAVLAHEFGHVSASHGRFSSWIYRIRQTWGQLLTRLEAEKRWGVGIFVRFAKWYAPLFNAYTFVLARAHEYEADRSAAEAAGARVFGETLVTMTVKGRLVSESFWPSIFKQVEQAPQPPVGVYQVSQQALAAPLEQKDAQKWLEAALSVPTGYSDTHPALFDRLIALGCFDQEAGGKFFGSLAVIAPLGEETAARYYLGAACDALSAQMSEAWQKHVAENWHARHDYVHGVRRGLQELEEKSQAQSLEVEEKWTRARWTAELEGGEVAVPLLREVLESAPEHVGANYLLGQILIAQNDAAGIDRLEAAMARDPDAVLPSCQAIYWYLRRQGQDERARQYESRLLGHQELLERAREESSRVSAKDKFAPHGLPREQTEVIAQQVAHFPELERAYFVRKQTRNLPEKPAYILGVVRRRRWIEISPAVRDRQFVQEIAANTSFPGHTLVIILNRGNRKLRRKIERITGAAIYDVRSKIPTATAVSRAG